MDLGRLIVKARTWLPLMVVAVLLFAATAFVVSSIQQKVYEARTTMIVGQALSAANPDYSQLLVAQNLSATYAAVAKTRPILEQLIDNLKLEVTPEELSTKVQVDAPSGSTLLFITAQDTAPSRAAAISNALAKQLIAASPTIQGREAAFQRSIDEDLAATQDLIDASQARADVLVALEVRTAEQEAELQTLEARLTSLRSTYATLLSFSSGTATNLLTVIEPAEAPTSPVWPRTLLNTLLAAALGLLVIIGIAFVKEQLDDSMKDSEAVEEVTGLSTLGTIAKWKVAAGRSEIYQLAALLYPRSTAAESYRTLRTNVDFASVDDPIRTLLVTSSSADEGKTTTASNLAVIVAQSGRKVVLVDADLRKPTVHAMFGLPNARGLTTLLHDEAAVLDAVLQRTDQDSLRVLTTGPLPPNPAELLGSRRMRAVLERLQQQADLIIFDSPPLQMTADAAVLSSLTDGTLLVIDAGRSRRRAARASREALDRAGATTIGVVLNRVPAGKQAGYGGYYGGYGESGEGRTQRPAVAGVAPEQPGPAIDMSGPP